MPLPPPPELRRAAATIARYFDPSDCPGSVSERDVTYPDFVAALRLLQGAGRCLPLPRYGRLEDAS